MAIFTTQHYKAIAEAIARVEPSDNYEAELIWLIRSQIIDSLSLMFAQDNERFNYSEFVLAATGQKDDR